MVRAPEELEELEAKIAREDKTTFWERLRLYDAMLAHARTVGAIPMADPLDGIDDDIRLAEAMHVLNNHQGARRGV